jgi:hypothetical protein
LAKNIAVKAAASSADCGSCGSRKLRQGRPEWGRYIIFANHRGHHTEVIMSQSQVVLSAYIEQISAYGARWETEALVR